MDEQDFRTALRATVTAASQPPPMAATPVLAAARRDRKRRHAMWAGAGSVAAVVAIAVGVVIVAPSTPGSGDGGREVGGTPPSMAPTDESEPGGTEDIVHVVADGPEHDKAGALVVELAAVVPAGYASPDDLVGSGDVEGMRLAQHQAQYENAPDGTKVWSYFANAPVTRGDGLGKLSVEVHTPAPGLSGPDGCELGPASCTEVLVGGKPVAVFPSTEDNEVGQTAAYRHEDGTVVYLRQATLYTRAGKPPLPALPFTAEQLAELATDRRFHVG